MAEPYILSINEGIHEASVTLLKGIELRVFVEQERHSRYRHHIDGVVTSDVIYKVLETEDITPEQIEYFCYCNLTDFQDISVGSNTGLLTLKQIVGAREFDTRWTNVKFAAINRSNHHEQHCAASFYASGFDSALGLVVDGSGDMDDSITLFKCSKKDGIIELKKYARKYSLGDLYSEASKAMELGNNAEGKLMGLASYYKSDWDYSNFDKETKEMKHENLFSWYLTQHPYPFESRLKDPIHYIRAAGEVQALFNNTLLDLTEYLKSFDPNEENLVIAGGCMLNCSANAEIEKQGLFKHIYCFPATNDAGISLGAAYLNAAKLIENLETKRIEHVYLGVNYPRSKTPLRLREINTNLLKDYNIQEVVDDLVENCVIAWYQGRSEAGPRALGHRTLLASPQNRVTLDFINKEIKGREAFRPLAPIVLDKYYLDIFEDPNPENLSPFMLKNVVIKKEWRHKIPAVCHIDNTARPQYLKREVNPELYDLIEAFYERTGIPMLINTSLNGKGEPIVETFADLMRFLEYHGEVIYAIVNGKKILSPRIVNNLGGK
ncbi:MAG: hypothetical protein J5691_00435 [Bacilli bacterium]|nr:hypothetical protein [Bacilli bacterium]